MNNSSKQFSLEELAEILKNNDIDPVSEFTADAGEDWGEVKTWRLAPNEYLIVTSNNAITDYFLAGHTEDLGVYLCDDSLYGFDAILRDRANLWHFRG